MLANQLTELVWAGISLVVVVGVGYLIIGRKITKVSVKAGPVEATMDLESLHKAVEEVKTIAQAAVASSSRVEESVNHRRDGDPTLAQRVEITEVLLREHRIHTQRQVEWQNNTLKRIAHHVGFIPDPEPPMDPITSETPLMDQEQKAS